MVRASEIRSGFISLNGQPYKLVDGTSIVSALATDFAERIIIGSPDESADPLVSYLVYDDYTEGIGLEEFRASRGGDAPKRAWFSDCDLSNVRHLTLGPLATLTTAPAGWNDPAGEQAKLPLATFLNEVYTIHNDAVAGNDNINIYKYNNGTDSWGSSLHTITTGSGSSDAEYSQDLVVGYVDGTQYIIASTRTAYSYSTDGSSWNDSTKDAEVLTIFDNILWGVDLDGGAWYATTPGTETDIARVPVPSAPGSSPHERSYITDLFVGRHPDGNLGIWCSTAFGLYAYDRRNDTWQRHLDIPGGRYNGLGAGMWNSDVYFPAGSGLYHIVVRDDELVVIPIGPDRDHGLPADRAGAIVDLAGGINRLYAAVNPAVTDFDDLVTGALGQAPVLGWDGVGWSVIWPGFDNGSDGFESPVNLHVSSAYGVYRLWISTTGDHLGSGTHTGTNVYYINIPSGRANPDQVQTRAYAASSSHLTPHFNVGNDVTGVAVSIVAETEGCSANETVTIGYDINKSGSFTNFSAITTDGLTEFPFPDATTPTGSTFRTIQFQIALARGGTNTNTPDLKSLTLKFLRKLPPRYIHQVSLDISGMSAGRSPREQWVDIRSAIDSGTLVEFTFREGGAAADTQRYWVYVRVPQGEEEGGLNYRGTADLVLVEPVHNN